MRRPWLMLVLVAISACARGAPFQNDAAVDTTTSGKMDASLDANNCAQQPCTILPACGCGGANTCDIDQTDFKGTSCRAVNAMGTETSTCTSPSQCGAGYVCLGSAAGAACKKYCSTTADCGTPRGQCVIHPSANNMAITGIPAVCSSNCDPIATSSPECPSTWKCVIATATDNNATVNIADCAPAGAGNQSAACVTGGNPDDTLCNKGYACSTTTTDTAPKCRRYCKPGTANNGGCGSNSCLVYSPAFKINGVEYGICSP
jgi:hypothetical protein